jgi:hypothetical protein
MITLTAKINLLSGDNNALSLGSTNLSGNNISSDLSNVIGVEKKGSNPFILGVSKLGDGSTFSDKVDYFIGNQSSGENGNFANEYVIAIKSKTPLNTITFAFDTINNRHPKNIKAVFETSLYTDYGIYNENNDIIEYPFRTNLILPKNAYNIRITKVLIENGASEEDNYEIEDLIFPNNEIRGKIVVYGKDQQYFDENPYVHFVVEYYLLYEDNDAIFTLLNLSNVTNFSIIIDNWNTPNYPLVLTGIYTAIDINIDYRNLISISRGIFDRSDLKLPSYGIISNTGNIEFNDTNGEILDYAEQLLLGSGLKCEIKLNNTLVDGASETIGLFKTDEWDYDNDNRVVSVSLKDDLEEWQDIFLKKKIWQNPTSLYEIMVYLIKNTPNKWEFVVNDETSTFLQTVILNLPYLEEGSLWSQWAKLCEIALLHIYINNKGKVIIKHLV